MNFYLHVVNDGGVVSDSLVIHAPAAACEHQLTGIHQGLGQVPHVLILVLPPPPEEACLHLNKLFIRILCKFFDHRLNNILNTSPEHKEG